MNGHGIIKFSPTSNILFFKNSLCKTKKICAVASESSSQLFDNPTILLLLIVNKFCKGGLQGHVELLGFKFDQLVAGIGCIHNDGYVRLTDVLMCGLEKLKKNLYSQTLL